MSWASKLFNKTNNKSSRSEGDYSVVEDIYRNSAGYNSAAASNEELIAVITAAIRAFTGGRNESGLVVRSFKRIRSGAPDWNAASLREQLS